MQNPECGAAGRAARRARGARRAAPRCAARRAARGANANAFARRAARPAAPHWILQQLFSALQLEFGLDFWDLDWIFASFSALNWNFQHTGLDFWLLRNHFFDCCTGTFSALHWNFDCAALENSCSRTHSPLLFSPLPQTTLPTLTRGHWRGLGAGLIPPEAETGFIPSGYRISFLVCYSVTALYRRYRAVTDFERELHSSARSLFVVPARAPAVAQRQLKCSSSSVVAGTWHARRTR